MNFEEVKEAFPIECGVELVDNQGEGYMHLQLGTRGNVVSIYDDRLILVSWEKIKYPSDVYFHWRFRVHSFQRV